MKPRCPVCNVVLRPDGTHDWDPYNTEALAWAARAAGVSMDDLSRLWDRVFNGERCLAPGCGLRLNADSTHRWPPVQG